MFIAIVGYHFGWVVYGWLGQYGGKLSQNPRIYMFISNNRASFHLW